VPWRTQVGGPPGSVLDAALEAEELRAGLAEAAAAVGRAAAALGCPEAAAPLNALATQQVRNAMVVRENQYRLQYAEGSSCVGSGPHGRRKRARLGRRHVEGRCWAAPLGWLRSRALSAFSIPATTRPSSHSHAFPQQPASVAEGSNGSPCVAPHRPWPPAPQLSHQPKALEGATTTLLAAVAPLLLPRYARWLLLHTHDLLAAGVSGTAPGAPAAVAAPPGGAVAAPRQARAALLLLRCTLRVPGLRLGPAASALLAEGPLLGAVASTSHGPLAAPALTTLHEALRFSQELRFRQDLAASGAALASPSSAASRDRDRAGAGPGAGPRTLFPPPSPVSAALKKVVDTLGSGVRRRSKNSRLLPYLGGAGGGQGGGDEER
jgi:hypothetical protein